jgi:hypothetical protein
MREYLEGYVQEQRSGEENLSALCCQVVGAIPNRRVLILPTRVSPAGGRMGESWSSHLRVFGFC